MLKELKVNSTLNKQQDKLLHTCQNELPKPSSGKLSPKSLSSSKPYNTDYNGQIIEKLSVKAFKERLKNTRSKIITPRFTQTSKFNKPNSNKKSLDNKSKLDTNAYTSPYITEFSNVDKYINTNQNDLTGNSFNEYSSSKPFSKINSNLKHHYSTKIKDFQDDYRNMLLKLTDLKAKHYKLEAEKLIFSSSITEQKAKLTDKTEYFKKQLNEYNQIKDDIEDLDMEYKHLVEIKDSTSNAASKISCQSSIPIENKIVDINDNKVLLNDLNFIQEKNRTLEKNNKCLLDELRKLEIEYNDILLNQKNDPNEAFQKISKVKSLFEVSDS